MDLAKRLMSVDEVAHWDFVFDHDDFYVCGQILVLSDGEVLERMGGSSSESDAAGRWTTTWRYKDWHHLMTWEHEVTSDAILRGLKNRGYSLAEASPVRPNQTEAGPFAGMPELANYL